MVRMENMDALIGLGTGGLFFVLLFLFTVHTVFLAYHWFTFGVSRQTATLALATYLTGGAILFLSLATTIALFP